MSDIIDITTTIVEDVVEITTTDNQTIVNVINQTGGGGGVQSVTGNQVDNTDPANPIVITPNITQVLNISDREVILHDVTSGDFTFDTTHIGKYIGFYGEGICDAIIPDDTYDGAKWVNLVGGVSVNCTVNFKWQADSKSLLVGGNPTKVISFSAKLTDPTYNGWVWSVSTDELTGGVLEYNNLASFPATGSSGLIYVAKDTNKTYRWSGSAYVALDEGAVLGETSSTAYRGDRGKAAYDHSQSSGNPHGTTATQVGAYTTSQVDALLAGMVKIIAKNASNPSITGTTSETIFTSFLISANTLFSIDTLRLGARYRKTGTAGLSTIKVYINTSNTLSGATQIAQNQTAASNLWFFIDRTFSISGGNIYGYPFSSSAASDVIGAGIALSSATLNPASNFYLIVTGLLGNGADTMVLDLFRATN